MKFEFTNKMTYKTKPTKATAFVFLPIGILMIYFGIKTGLSTKEFLATAVAANGTIIRYENSTKNNSSTPVVSFRTKTGKAIEFTSEVSSNPPRYKIGQNIKVLYLEEKPSNAKINSAVDLWMPSVILLFIGITFTLVAVSILKKDQENVTGTSNENFTPKDILQTAMNGLQEKIKEQQDLNKKI